MPDRIAKVVNDAKLWTVQERIAIAAGLLNMSNMTFNNLGYLGECLDDSTRHALLSTFTRWEPTTEEDA